MMHYDRAAGGILLAPFAAMSFRAQRGISAGFEYDVNDGAGGHPRSHRCA